MAAGRWERSGICINTAFIWLLSILSLGYALAAQFMMREPGTDGRRQLASLLLSSLSIWALCYAVSLSRPDAQSALLWRKLSTLGWGTFYSLLYHFVVLVTGNQAQTRRPWFYFFVYAGAALNIILFLILPGFSSAQYQMVYLYGFWVNQWIDTPANWYYMAYYLFFFTLSVLLLIRWAKQAADSNEKRHALLFLLSLAAAVLLSFLLDGVLQTYVQGRMLAQILVVCALIPAFTINYIMRRYAFMRPDTGEEQTPNDHILTREARRKTYFIAALCLYVLSFVAFYSSMMGVDMFLPAANTLGNLVIALLLMAVSQVIFVLDRMKLPVHIQENVLFVAFLALDMMLFLRYASNGAVTVWATILMLVIPSIMFNNITLVMVGGAVHMLFMAATAARYPNLQVIVNMEDHIWRMLFILAALVMAYFINRIYRLRLLENSQYALQQQSVSRVATLFSEGGLDEYEHRCRQALTNAQTYLAPDELFLVEAPARAKGLEQNGPQPLPDIHINPCWLGSLPLDQQLERLFVRDAQGGYCVQVKNLDKQAAPLRLALTEKQLTMLHIYPLNTPDRERSLLLAVHKQERAEQSRHRNQGFAQILSSLLTSYIVRTYSEAELEYTAYHDRLTRLLKRERFLELMEARLHNPGGAGEFQGLLFLDINGFKRINDVAGHIAGDQALSEVARRLQVNATKEDLIGRFGGDEFVVFITRMSREEIEGTAHMLQEALSFDYAHESGVFPLSVAAGLALADKGSAIDQLIARADEAMYADKRRRKLSR